MPILFLLLLAACTTSHELHTQKLQEKEAQIAELKTPPDEDLEEKEVQELASEQNAKAIEAAAESVEENDSPDIPKDAESKVKDLKIDEVAAKLGLNEKSLRGQVWQMDRLLRKASSWRQICGQLYSENKKMCDYVKQAQLSASSYENPGTASILKTRIKIKIKPHQFSLLQRVHYQQLLSSLERYSSEEVLSWTAKITDTRSCPRNLSAAAIRKLETSLPSTKIQAAIESLYEHSSECLRPTDYAYESTHLRQGLLRLTWGNESGAKEAFLLAVQAKKTFERRRALYWAGLTSGSTRERELYWRELTEEYPLTFHALEVWRNRGEDPFILFSKKPYLKPSRFLTYQKNAKAKAAQEGIYWLEALHLLGQRTAAPAFASLITKAYPQEFKAANIIYMAQLKEAHSSTGTTLVFLNKQISDNPEVLNKQTLEMLFPRPYFGEFQKATQTASTDPYLLLSVARQESSFNPLARSPANARGIMQILPSTARVLSGNRYTNLYSPEKNIKLGAQYMAQLTERFGSVEKALAAYNAGPNRVVEWEKRYPVSNMLLFMDLIPFRETRNYVTKILCNNYWYEKLYADKNKSSFRNTWQRPSALKSGKSLLVSRLVNMKTKNKKDND
ncbi:MAG: lytic transglycosylase domain-containing protein [Proteobacteria bacterium]|nr:lytic transglycosylase domain-containing protein [Pseudomonadota bacterium]